MKTCPQCDNGYHDSCTTCPKHGAFLSEIRDLKPGMLIRNTYRIVRKLGQGGMGTVYLAHHTLMDEPRAMKFLSSEFVNDRAFSDRFLREARTLRQLSSKNIVRSGDLEQAEDDTLFFSMEFVAGPNLRDYLRDAPKPFDVPLALAITQGIAEGLGEAHALGMVHRDIKPENILMARDGDGYTPKIADFGIVATKESSSVYTKTGSSLLTVAYAAPEQWRGMSAADLDGRTDFYALGGVLFEMLTGRTVFNADNYEGWSYQHQSAAPGPPSGIRPELKSWQNLDALVLRLLAKDRNQRPKVVCELLNLLDAVRHAPESLPDTIVRSEPIVERASSRIAAGKGLKTSRRWGIWFVLLATALFLSAFAVWFTSQRQKGSTNPVSQTLPVIRPQAEISHSEQPVPATLPSAGSTNIKPPNPEPGNAQKPKPPQVEPSKPSVQEPSLAELDKRAGAFYDQKRYADAAPLYDKACAGGLGGDCNRLGTMYEHGEGVAQDNSRAVELYSKGCVTGSPASCDDLVLIYKKGGTSAQDKDRVVALFSHACDSGNANGCASLGFMYEVGVGVGRDASRAATLYSKACDAGDARGCLNLGSMYGIGNGVARDYSRSAMLSSKACDGGEALGCFNLGLGYENGLGVNRDYSAAATLYSKACDAGIAIGCGRLGFLYASGNGVAKDSTRAASLFHKSCDGGFAVGCLNLGILNETGNGVAKDYVRAAALYSKACNVGSARGCANLGNLYEYGEGVAKNYPESATLYSKACNGGDAGGCSNLGNLYLNG